MLWLYAATTKHDLQSERCPTLDRIRCFQLRGSSTVYKASVGAGRFNVGGGSGRTRGSLDMGLRLNLDQN